MGTSISTTETEEGLLVHSEGERPPRTVLIKVSGMYDVEPRNPLKLKHRGRRCTVIDYEGSSRPRLTHSAAVGFRVRPSS